MDDANKLQQLNIFVQETKEENLSKEETIKHQPILCKRNYTWWFRIIFFTFFLLAGQSAGTLLSRFYYNNGGKSKWTTALLQVVGFPILLFPFFLSKSLLKPTNSSISTTTNSKHQHLSTTIVLVYFFLGLLLGGDTLMYSYGLCFLPVSTYSLICATQLAFNALFSFFINSEKFTPFTVNSLVLLTISATLLVVGESSGDQKGVKGKFAIGFICTVAASATYSLLLSLTQLSFQKVLKRNTVMVVLELTMFISAFATCFCVVGLFASGEWKGLKNEMDGFEHGKLSYIMTLIWATLSWQVCNIGSVGLIFQVSSLFSNVISTIALPLIPILAVGFFQDKMDGIKVVAMLLAIWGFISYIYQHYADESESKLVKRTDAEETFHNSCTQ